MLGLLCWPALHILGNGAICPVATELADVEIALARLDNGSYWTDEVTGEPLPDELLERSPVTRRLPEA